MADSSIAGIGAVPAVAAPISTGSTARTDRASKGGFGQALTQAISDVDDLQRQAGDATTSLARGEQVNMADTVLAVEKANIALSFTVQIRNKLLEAYQELMRMQI